MEQAAPPADRAQFTATVKIDRDSKSFRPTISLTAHWVNDGDVDPADTESNLYLPTSTEDKASLEWVMTLGIATLADVADAAIIRMLTQEDTREHRRNDASLFDHDGPLSAYAQAAVDAALATRPEE